MWSAFVTGFATKATELIEDRDKEIQDTIKIQLNEMYKSRQKALQTAETKRDELRQTASQLRGLGVPDAAISQIISSGDADKITELIRKEAETSGPDAVNRKVRAFMKGEPTPLPESLDERINKMTAPTARADRAPLVSQTQGAFGLPSRAGQRTVSEFLASTGMTQEELERTEVPEMPLLATSFDYSVFGKEEKSKGVIELENKLADIAADMEGNTPEEKMRNAVATEEGKQLQAQIAGRVFLEAQRKARAEQDPNLRARSTDQIRKLVTTRLQEEVAPLQFKEITFDPTTQDFVVTIPGSEEAKRFLTMRRSVVQDVFTNAGLLRNGKLIDRNAADAISPYAVVDYDNLTIQSWRPVAGSAPAAGTPTPGQPRGGPIEGFEAPAAPAPAAVAPGPRPAGAPPNAKPIPRTADNKIDRSKLVAGEPYYSSTGEVRIWNGTNFQSAR
jgi:hypothetical protein